MILSVILLSVLTILLSTLSKFDQASDLWQKLELTFELESDVWDTADWDRKWLVGFSAGKTQSDQPNNSGAIYVKMSGSVFEEK